MSVQIVTDRTSVINLIERDYNVSRETISKLEIYAECLIEWQSKFNLIGNYNKFYGIGTY